MFTPLAQCARANLRWRNFSLTEIALSSTDKAASTETRLDQTAGAGRELLAAADPALGISQPQSTRAEGASVSKT